MKKKRVIVLLVYFLPFLFKIGIASAAQDAVVKYTLVSTAELAPVDTILRQSIKKLFPAAEETYLEYTSEKAKRYIKELDMQFVPFVVFDKAITATDAFFHMVRHQMVDKVKGYYVIPEGQLKMGGIMLLSRERIPHKLDVFVGGLCPYSRQAQAFLRDFAGKGTDINIRMRYLADVHEFGISAEGGEEEIKEDLRQIIIQQYHPQKFWEYLRLTQEQSPQAALEKLAIPPSFIESKKEEALKIIRADFTEARLLGVVRSPAFLWENRYLIPTVEMLKPHLDKR